MEGYHCIDEPCPVTFLLISGGCVSYIDSWFILTGFFNFKITNQKEKKQNV